MREGLWASETYALLSKQTGIPVKEYVKAAKDTEAIGLPKEAEGKVEGWLFPSTYEFGREVDRHAAAQGHGRPDRQGARRRRRRAARTAQKVLTLASLVEAEAKLDVDRPKIARVFLNRLETDGPPAYGLIQSDAAVLVRRPAPRRCSRPRPSSTTRATPTTPASTRVCRRARSATRARPRSRRRPTRPTAPWFFFVAVNPITGETKFAHDPGRAQRATSPS